MKDISYLERQINNAHEIKSRAGFCDAKRSQSVIEKDKDLF